MRKLYTFILTLAVIGLVAGVSYSANVPKYINSFDGEAEVWTTEVYFELDLSLPEALSVGDVVVWDIGSSTGDDNNWVVSTTTADTFLVAGVVYGSDIGSGATGTIAIRGIVDADVNGTVAAGDILCTSTTRGELDQCSDLDGDPNAVGFATEAGTDTQVKVMLFGR